MLALKSALAFIVNFIFDLYIYILIVRLFLQKFSASWHNPFTQLIVKLTNPVVKPLRRFIPGFKGYDFSIILLCLLLEFLLLWLLIWIQFNVLPGMWGVLILAISQFLTKVVNLFLVVIIIAAVLSWFPKLRDNPVSEIALLLAGPLLRMAQRILPTLGGIDFSPIIIVLLCFLVKMLILTPIAEYGMALVLSSIS